MQSFSLACLILAAAVPILAAGPQALAQVTVNTGALQQLHASPSPAASSPRPRASSTRATIVHHAGPPVVPKLPAPTIAVTPPEIAQLPPPEVVAVRPVRKAIPPMPVASAVGDAVAITGGLRLDFAPQSSDLNPAMDSALRAFAKQALPGPVTLDAFAAGDPNDPSTPRRLSLARVLAARAILIDAGFASDKIYPRAHGPADDHAGLPADRLEIVTMPTPPASPSSAATTPPSHS